MPPLALMRGIENLYLGVPRQLWDRQCQVPPCAVPPCAVPPCAVPISYSNHIQYNYALPGALPSCPTHVQEAQVASRSYTERALATIRGFQPAAHFPVSEEWGFLIEDNLEFYLKVPEERFIGGVLKSSQLLNTTTSEYAAPDVLCPPVLCPPVLCPPVLCPPVPNAIG